MDPRQEHRDIMMLNPNVNGNDYVIGDVHGSHQALQSLTSMLGEDDRLCIVGDLIDKGKDSLGVINFILEHNLKLAARGRSPQIYSVCGNHELMYLKAMDAIEEGLINAEDPDLFIDLLSYNDTSEAIELYLYNGGKWLIDLYRTEYYKGWIAKSGDTVNYTSSSQVGQVTNYIASLPYIYYVRESFQNGILPYKIVHADMPFDDDELLTRITTKNFMLSDAEIFYAVWARDLDHFPSWFVPLRKDGEFGRVLTYTGHTIITPDNVELAVRSGENTIVTDIGTFSAGHILLVNHTRLKALLLSDAMLQEFPSLDTTTDGYDLIVTAVNEHLGLQLVITIISALANQTLEKLISLQIMEWLISAGAKLDQLVYVKQDDASYDMLSAAVAAQHTEAIQRLFDLHIDPSSNHNLAFINAIWLEKIALIKMFIDTGRLDINAQEVDDGLSALHAATQIGNYAIVKMLLEAGANAASMDKRGRIPVDLTYNEDITYLLDQYLMTKYRAKPDSEMYLPTPTEVRMPMPLTQVVEEEEILDITVFSSPARSTSSMNIASPRFGS